MILGEEIENFYKRWGHEQNHPPHKVPKERDTGEEQKKMSYQVTYYHYLSLDPKSQPLVRGSARRPTLSPKLIKAPTEVGPGSLLFSPTFANAPSQMPYLIIFLAGKDREMPTHCSLTSECGPISFLNFDSMSIPLP